MFNSFNVEVVVRRGSSNGLEINMGYYIDVEDCLSLADHFRSAHLPAKKFWTKDMQIHLNLL